MGVPGRRSERMNPDASGVSASRPVLLGTVSVPRAIPARGGGGGRVAFRSVEQRIARLDTRFDEALAAFDVQVELTKSIQAADPQLVLVFEALDEQIDLTRVAADLGLEVLTESEGAVEPSDEFVLTASRPRSPLIASCLHAVCLNQQAFDRLRTLWGAWKRDRALDRGLSPLRDLFLHLRDVRPWGPQDRLRTVDWDRYFEGLIPDRLHTIEIELWYRRSSQRRQRAQRDVTRLITDAGGQILSSAVIEQIGYHGIKCSVPTAMLADLAAGRYDAVQVVRSADVMYLRISAQAAYPATPATATDVSHEGPMPGGLPVVCLFDGLPASNHPLLNGRVVIHDPDDLATDYTVEQRKHGTWMASAAVWGDRSSGGDPAPRPILVRPILVPSEDTRDRHEELPVRELVPDLMWRAFRELFDPGGDIEPVAPQVAIVNLSVGDPAAPFDSVLSAWARMLDWLSYQYGVLVIVAAGNRSDLPLTPSTSGELVGLAGDERRQSVLLAQRNDQNERRLLAPAESINAITVGAVHADASGVGPSGYTVDPADGLLSISPVTSFGPGYRRSVKPDLAADGGRALFRHPDSDAHRIRFTSGSALGPGIRVAAPGTQHETFTVGTSAAAVLTTRQAARLHDLVEDITAGMNLSRRQRAAAVKALLVHGCGDLGNFHTTALPVEQALGNGALNRDLSQGCTTNEAVLLFVGTIGATQEQDLLLPLPNGLAVRETKRIDATLAWLSPVNWRHRQYRRAALSFVKPAGAIPVLGKACGLDSDTAVRGATTVQRQAWETQKAFAAGQGSNITVRVKCYEQAGGLGGETIDYAAALSLWVAPSIGVDVYTQVRDQIRARVAVRPS